VADRTQAEIWVYPLDLEVSANTEAEDQFRNLLDEVLSAYGVLDHDISDPGVNYWLLEDVNYGTGAFENAKLGPFASAAGLWYAHADEGHVEWGPHGDVYVPTLERTFGWDFTALSQPTLSSGLWSSFDAAGHADIRVRSYFRLASLTLDEWAKIPDLELAELLDEVLSSRPEDA
jgi:hypothetical protein